MTFCFLIIKSTISLIVIGLKKPLFPTNSLAKLLSDSLLSDSSVSQSHLKFLRSSRLSIKFSLSAPQEMYRKQYGEDAF